SLSRDDCLNSFHTACLPGAASSTTASSSIRSSPRKSMYRRAAAVEAFGSAASVRRLLLSVPGDAVPETQWTPADMTLVRIFQCHFNSCRTPASCPDKSCAQVASFIRREANLKRRGADLSCRRRAKKPQKCAKRGRVNGGRRAPGQQVSQSHYYHPCDHPGRRCDDQCSCRWRQFLREILPVLVGLPEPVCRLAAASLSATPSSAPAVLAVRECDPDLCCTCGADAPNGNCRNVALQRGLRKHLLMAPSDVAGWGIFLRDSAERGDFIYEYCGEVITQDEADRRGKVYDKYMSSFLFKPQPGLRGGRQRAKAIRSGSPITRCSWSNGDHRIGIFANRPIAPGEELFFDYRYGPMEQLKYVGIERERQAAAAAAAAPPPRPPPAAPAPVPLRLPRRRPANKILPR
uniref:SET domain-containing protein n=1 Tax=Macrostomum lignano TaxID=282301 RepID=A0A1I8F679_9PLAT